MDSTCFGIDPHTRNVAAEAINDGVSFGIGGFCGVEIRTTFHSFGHRCAAEDRSFVGQGARTKDRGSVVVLVGGSKGEELVGVCSIGLVHIDVSCAVEQ